MKNAIEIKNLVKKYSSSEKNAVDDISFDVKEGELFAFLGVNGAGKSTTINILCTLLSKTSGKVSICDFDIDRDIDAIKRNIGIVFQGNVLDNDLSVRDNITIRGNLYDIPKEKLASKIEYLSEKLGMSDFLSKKYGNLSGGQRRKADIVRALVTEPSILFLDEPTTGLDPQSREELWNIIKSVKEKFNTTIFLTTHYMEEVDIADTVAIIDEGKILCMGTPQMLKSKYSMDTIKITPFPKDLKSVLIELTKQKIKFTLQADTLIISVKNATEYLSMLSGMKHQINSVEIIKGTMDSVFLNIVGRKLTNE